MSQVVLLKLRVYIERESPPSTSTTCKKEKKREMGTKSKTNVHLNDKPHGQIKWENEVNLNVYRELYVYLHNSVTNIS